MAGFVPGRDLNTLDGMAPDEARRRKAAETADRRAILDKEELAELERAESSDGSTQRKRSLLDRLLRRG